VNFFDELQAVLKALEASGTDYALCGGVALAIHGAPRATQDIDLLLPPDNIAALRAVAYGCGFTLESFPMDFASGLTIQRFTKLIGNTPLMLDVLFVNASLEKVWADRQAVPFQGGTVRVVSREGLIALKLAAGRPQDVADVKRLEELSRG
jgi:predicted nucleotidyltransferase